MIERLKKQFEQTYGKAFSHVYFAPGRVNLIGEHTDYNGGHVFPCALDSGTYLLVCQRTDSLCRFYSENFSELGIIEVNLDRIENVEQDHWANYPKGVIKVMSEAGYAIRHGFDFYFYGNIPNGAGLSSSASIELVTSVMLNEELNLGIDTITLVKFCQKAENTFIGVNCGIMDQFAIGLGKKDHAILLDTNTLKYTYAPLLLNGYKIVVTNTNKRRGLADSKYNERRSECETALEILQKVVNIKSLGDLSIEQFNEVSHLLRDEVICKRAKHAVYENQRTMRAQKALSEGDLTLFGKLMNESHQSLRDDYCVTGIELDTLVSLAWLEEGVIGTRMTGAGFGGCTVSIVCEQYVENFKTNIETKYEKLIGYKPSFYVVNVGDGARKLE